MTETGMPITPSGDGEPEPTPMPTGAVSEVETTDVAAGTAGTAEATRPAGGSGGQRAGMDVPGVGHVSYPSLGFLGGLAVGAAVGLLEWPVAAAVGVAYALARRHDHPM